jgi:hypothetical protein
MKPAAIRKCAAAECTTFSAFTFCARHRRLQSGHTTSTAERVRAALPRSANSMTRCINPRRTNEPQTSTPADTTATRRHA